MAMTPHMAFTIAFMIGITPAIAITYFTLRDYERYLKDNLLYFCIVTGLFLGILVSFFHLIITAFTFTYLSLLLTIGSFALFENLVKLVFVQLKRFEAQFQTTYYGTVFGLMIGASITMGRTYAIFSGELAWYEITGILLFAFAMILMNGGMGTWLGYAVYKKDVFSSMVTAVLISVPFNFLILFWYLFLFVWGSTQDDLIYIAIAFCYGLGVFLFAYSKVMPDALPLKYKRKKLIEDRRKQRE